MVSRNFICMLHANKQKSDVLCIQLVVHLMKLPNNSSEQCTLNDGILCNL